MKMHLKWTENTTIYLLKTNLEHEFAFSLMIINVINDDFKKASLISLSLALMIIN